MKSDKKFLDVLSEVVKELMGPMADDVEVVEKKVVENLVKKGYDVTDITDALEEIFEQINTDYAKDMKMRILHPREVANLTDGARNYFFDLREDGIILEDEFEALLNKFAGLKYRVDENELNIILNEMGIVVNYVVC